MGEQQTRSNAFRSLIIGYIRNIMASLTRNRSGPGEKTDSIPNDDMVEYYRQRAVGEAGLIITGMP
jgi:2,4-dienoyl-CoA reductase-like NADH-dependent reductase (Old Yellow Enzyme family)